MRYFVINKRGEIICNLGGYKTKKGAEEGRRSLCSPIFSEAIEETRRLGFPIGDEFAENVHNYIRENSEIIEVSEIILRQTSGPDITQKL
jgi:uncharacterized protein YegP (UPF0339 family)